MPTVIYLRIETQNSAYLEKPLQMFSGMLSLPVEEKLYRIHCRVPEGNPNSLATQNLSQSSSSSKVQFKIETTTKTKIKTMIKRFTLPLAGKLQPTSSYSSMPRQTQAQQHSFREPEAVTPLNHIPSCKNYPYS